MPAKSLKYLEKDFILGPGRLNRIIKDLQAEMVKGLCGKKSSLKMIPAYVDSPSGKEKGKFIVLDLGGTNLRISLIELGGGGEITKLGEGRFILEKKHTSVNAKQLFNFICACLKEFIKKSGISPEKEYNLGFTFSFPIKQTGIASGLLLHWTKEFSASGVVGKDVVKLLEDSLKKNGLMNIRITALVNDTVGTLMACAYADSHCDAAVILGTGTNACYRERSFKIFKWPGRKDYGSRMIINTEWGNFNKLSRTNYDILLDKESENPGSQILEKMVSGKYLGEISRRIFLDLSGKYISQGDFKTEYMSEIEFDRTKNLMITSKLLKKMGVKATDLTERSTLKKICRMVSIRAASISAAAIASVIIKIDPGLSCKHTVAIDGSVYEKYPGFPENIKSSLKSALGAKSGKIKLTLTKDGSGIGAAVVAAIGGKKNA